MNTLQQAEAEVGDIIEAGLELAQEVEDVVDLFIGKNDKSSRLASLLEKVSEFRKKIEVFAGEEIFGENDE